MVVVHSLACGILVYCYSAHGAFFSDNERCEFHLSLQVYVVQNIFSADRALPPSKIVVEKVLVGASSGTVYFTCVLPLPLGMEGVCVSSSFADKWIAWCQECGYTTRRHVKIDGSGVPRVSRRSDAVWWNWLRLSVRGGVCRQGGWWYQKCVQEGALLGRLCNGIEQRLCRVGNGSVSARVCSKYGSWSLVKVESVFVVYCCLKRDTSWWMNPSV